jgi:predicted phosphodiesterase
LGDLHIGNAGFELKEYKKTVKWILEEDIKTILMGDLLDCILVNDKRFNFLSVDKTFIDSFDDLADYTNKCYWRLLDLLEPLQDNLLGVIRGNHEAKLLKHGQDNQSKKLANELDIPYLQYSGVLLFKFKRSQYVRKNTLWYHHGFGGGGSQEAAIRKLKDKAKDFYTDMYIMGHTHKPIATQDAYYGIESNNRLPRLIKKYRSYMVTCSYLDTYTEGNTNYGEEKGYSPNIISRQTFKIYPEDNKILI